MPDTTLHAATAVVIKQGQVLLHKRRDFRIWALPGGKIEPGETTEQAAIREVKEETGYDIALEGLVGEYYRPQIPNGNGIVYLGRVIGGTPIEQGPETRALQWFDPQQLPLSLPRAHRLVIADALAYQGQSVNRTLSLAIWEVLTIRGLRWLRNRLLRFKRG